MHTKIKQKVSALPPPEAQAGGVQYGGREDMKIIKSTNRYNIKVDAEKYFDEFANFEGNVEVKFA